MHTELALAFSQGDTAQATLRWEWHPTTVKDLQGDWATITIALVERPSPTPKPESEDVVKDVAPPQKCCVVSGKHLYSVSLSVLCCKMETVEHTPWKNRDKNEIINI